MNGWVGVWSSSFSSSASMNLHVIWGFSLPSDIVLGARLTLVVLGLFCCVNAVCFVMLHGGHPRETQCRFVFWCCTARSLGPRRRVGDCLSLSR